MTACVRRHPFISTPCTRPPPAVAKTEISALDLLYRRVYFQDSHAHTTRISRCCRPRPNRKGPELAWRKALTLLGSLIAQSSHKCLLNISGHTKSLLRLLAATFSTLVNKRLLGYRSHKLPQFPPSPMHHTGPYIHPHSDNCKRQTRASILLA